MEWGLEKLVWKSDKAEQPNPARSSLCLKEVPMHGMSKTYRRGHRWEQGHQHHGHRHHTHEDETYPWGHRREWASWTVSSPAGRLGWQPARSTEQGTPSSRPFRSQRYSGEEIDNFHRLRVRHRVEKMNLLASGFKCNEKLSVTKFEFWAQLDFPSFTQSFLLQMSVWRAG